MSRSKKKNVVIVNDAVTPLSWMGKILKQENLDVVTFSESADALDYLQNVSTPDLIIIDLHMPKIDGLKFCRMIRSPGFKPLNNAPVLIVSSACQSTISNDITRGLGASAFLTLPCEKDVFRRTALGLLQLQFHINQPRVLVIDDSEDVQNLLSSVLTSHGHTVIPARTGTEGIELCQSENPDIVILDHILPDTTGLELIPRIKANNNPIVITVTGNPTPQLAIEYAYAGAESYIQKPIGAVYLIDLLNKLYRERTLLNLEGLLDERTEQLKQSEMKYRAIVEDMTDFICRITPDMEVIFANESFCNHINISHAEIDRRKFTELMSTTDARKLQNAIRKLSPEKPTISLNSAMTIENATHWHRWTIHAVYDQTDDIAEYLCVGHDITEQKRSHNELMNAREAAVASNRAKTKFLTHMSHEIRTPLNGVIGMITLLNNSRLNKKQSGWTSIADSSAKHMLTIVDDILDLSRIEAGKLALASTTFNVDDVISDVMENIAATISPEDKIVFKSRSEGKLPPLVMGDPVRLRQVLYNLAQNAVKFTKEGYVTIRTSLKEEKPETFVIHFQVSDTGTGIQSCELPLLFESFYQSPDGDSAQEQGTGLGLAISKQLVEAMGGTIGVESEKNVGSTFWFSIPFQKPAKQADKTKPEAIKEIRPWKDMKLLVVDDDSVSRTIVMEYSSLLEVNSDVVSTPDEALAAVKDNHYDLILMDIELSEGNGNELARIIRNSQPDCTSHDTRIYAFTAHTASIFFEKCLESGMDGFLMKPLTLETFKTTLAEVAMPSGTSVAKSQKQASDNREPRAGNNKTSRKVTSIFLSEIPGRMDRLQKALESGEQEQARQTAHSIKSASLTVWEDSLSETAQQIEDMATTGDLEKALEFLTLFREHFEKYSATALRE